MQNEESDDNLFRLRLYVTGASPNSVRAINNLQLICEKHLKGCYTLEIIDIHQQPEGVSHEDVTAVPMLIKKTPLPLKRLIGDLSNENKVLRGLGLL